MDVETKEQVVTEGEQEDVTVESPSSEAGAGEKTEVSGESEGEDKETAPKLDEETRQKVISEEYAKWQSKTLTPITKERDTLRQQVTDLNAQLDDKHDNKELDLLLKADIEELGEDEAKKIDQIRRNYTTKLRDYRDNIKKVETAVKDNETIAEKLGGIERRQMAVEKAHGILLPQDKNFKKQLDAIVEELEQAETPEHMERLLKIILRERSGKQKPFTPDSGRQSGSGIDLSKLSTEERLTRALKEMDRKK